jgi:hypothetical protein
MDRAVLGGHDGPARLRPPGDAVMLLGERIEGRREVGCIDDPLLFRRQVGGEARTPSGRIQTRLRTTSGRTLQ